MGINNKKKISLVIFLLCFLIATAAYLFYISPPAKTATSTEGATKAPLGTTAATSTPVTVSAESVPPVASTGLSDTNLEPTSWRSVAQRCLRNLEMSDVNLDSIKSMDELFKKLAEKQESSETTLRNLHYTINGREYRLHMFPPDKPEGNSHELSLKLFTVGEDGFPDLQQLPRELQKKSNQEVINYYASQGGEPTFEESSQSFTLSNKAQLLIHLRDKVVVEGQLFLPGGGAFNCEQTLENSTLCVCQ